MRSTLVEPPEVVEPAEPPLDHEALGEESRISVVEVACRLHGRNALSGRNQRPKSMIVAES